MLCFYFLLHEVTEKKKGEEGGGDYVLELKQNTKKCEKYTKKRGRKKKEKKQHKREIQFRDKKIWEDNFY